MLVKDFLSLAGRILSSVPPNPSGRRQDALATEEQLISGLLDLQVQGAALVDFLRQLVEEAVASPFVPEQSESRRQLLTIIFVALQRALAVPEAKDIHDQLIDAVIGQVYIPELVASDAPFRPHFEACEFLTRLCTKYPHVETTIVTMAQCAALISSLPSSIISSYGQYTNTQSLSLFTAVSHLVTALIANCSSSPQHSSFKAEIWSLVMHHIQIEDTPVVAETLSSLLPAFLPISTPTSSASASLSSTSFGTEEDIASHIRQLWDVLTTMYNSPLPTVQRHVYAALCQFHSAFFRFSSKSGIDLPSDAQFWGMIRAGILTETAFTRKRCVYLMKRCIEHCVQQAEDNNTVYFSGKAWTPVFSWTVAESKQLQAAWASFFIINETLDDFPLHLVTPVWKHFEQLLEVAVFGETSAAQPEQKAAASSSASSASGAAGGKGKKGKGSAPSSSSSSSASGAVATPETKSTVARLPFSWIAVLIHRAFQHSNLAVTKLAQFTVLSIFDGKTAASAASLSAVSEVLDQSFVLELLLPNCTEPKLFYNPPRPDAEERLEMYKPGSTPLRTHLPGDDYSESESGGIVYTMSNPFGVRLISFLKNYILAIPSDENRITFIRKLIRFMSNPRTSRVGTCYLLNTLCSAELGTYNAIGDSEIEDMIVAIEFNCSTQPLWLEVRMELAYVRTLVLHADPARISIAAFGKLLGRLAHESFVYARASLSSYIQKWTTESGQPWLLSSLAAYLDTCLSVPIISASDFAARFTRCVALLSSKESQQELSVQDVQKAVLSPLFEYLATVYSHPYTEKGRPERALHILSSLLQNRAVSPSVLVDGVALCLEEVQSYILSRLSLSSPSEASLSNPDLYDEDMIDALLTGISTLGTIDHSSSTHAFLTRVYSESTSFLQQFSSLPTAADQTRNAVFQHTAIEALSTVLRLLAENASNPSSASSSSSVLFPVIPVTELEHTLSVVLSSKLTPPAATGMWPNRFRRLNKSKWNAINCLLHLIQIASPQGRLPSTSPSVLLALELCSDLFNCSDEIVEPVLDSLKMLLPDVVLTAESVNTALLDTVLADSWRTIRDLQRGWELPCMALYTSIIFSPEVLACPHYASVGGTVAHDQFKKMLTVSETLPRLAVFMAMQLSSILSNPSTCPTMRAARKAIALYWQDEIGDLAIFGRPHEDFEYMACLDALRFHPSLRLNENLPGNVLQDGAVRGSITWALRCSVHVDKESSQLLLENMTLRLFERLFNKKMNDGINIMPGSDAYRTKIRVMQLLNYMHLDIVNESNITTFGRRLIDYMTIPNALTIRRLAEMLGMNFGLRFPAFVDMLTAALQDWDARSQAVTSLCTMAGQILLFCPHDPPYTYYRQIVPPMLALCASNFHALRLAAQIFLNKAAVKLNEEMFGKDLLRLVQMTTDLINTNSDVQKWFNKTGHFYTMHPLEAICAKACLDLKKKDGTQVLDECIPLEMLDRVTARPKSELMSCANITGTYQHMSRYNIIANQWSIIPPFTEDPAVFDTIIQYYNDPSVLPSNPDFPHYNAAATQELEQEVQESAKPRSAGASESEEVGSETPAALLGQMQFQMKIQPWENQLSLADELSGSRSAAQAAANIAKKQDIVIVASLVDRAPNLGGLIRTCEIFQAHTLVIADKKIMSHPDFVAVSVSASQWVNVEECVEPQLPEYLATMREQGYAILGLEQTSDSVPLQHFDFPQKCVLLLGKEREGIPAELLPCLDVAIEIPQLGIVRSLNVHVAASIMLFEYTRQALLKAEAAAPKS